MSHKAHDARAVANEFLAIAKERGKKLTLMQLIKLVYLAQGWSLALRDRSLVEGNAQAWQYGPVYPEIYSAFKKFGSAPITQPAQSRQSGAVYAEEFDREEFDLLEAVFNAYGDMHAFQLSNMMHKPGTPWTITFDASGPYSEIRDELIKEHFNDLKKNGAQTN